MVHSSQNLTFKVLRNNNKSLDDYNNKSFEGFSMSTFWSADLYHHSWVGCKVVTSKLGNGLVRTFSQVHKTLKNKFFNACEVSTPSYLSSLIARVSYVYSTLMLESCVLRNETPFVHMCLGVSFFNFVLLKNCQIIFPTKIEKLVELCTRKTHNHLKRCTFGEELTIGKVTHGFSSNSFSLL
jgi:hypothetical protein